MHVAGMKNWFHYMHAPHGHGLMLRVSHLVHDKRFWAIVALLALTALIVGLGIWASMAQGPAEGPLFSPRLY